MRPSFTIAWAWPHLRGGHSEYDGPSCIAEEEPHGLAALAPSAVASLAQAGHEAQAAALAAAHLGIHPAFSGISNSRAILKPYLAGTNDLTAIQRAPQEGIVSSVESEDLSVPEAVSQVWGILRGQCHEALKHLYTP